MPEPSITTLAATLGTTPDQMRAVVKRTLDRITRSRYYVFRITGAAAAERTTSDQPRLIAAFPSPDDALAFAQRNGYGSNAQLRPIATADLVLLLLSDASIGTVLFLEGGQNAAVRGFGPGLRINRRDLLHEVQAAQSSPDSSIELTARHYDALQFGVNFTRRAEFRVALAQAIEQVVESYQPPAGSLDMGPRSIFATTAVEAWLKEHGFPHAHQRRWIAVVDDPAWGGAVELCEIDGGTENRLLIQLAIHADQTGRQYIKWVNVTA
jgi:hypothetical protein